MDSVDHLPKSIYSLCGNFTTEVPSVESSHVFLKELVRFLFPVKANRTVSVKSLEKELRILRFRLSELLLPLSGNDGEKAEATADEFFKRLPGIYKKLKIDAETFLNSDPAAKGLEEVIMSYPGFFAITVYRIAHELHTMEIPLLPRLMSEYVHGKTGIDIHPGAKIGDCFFIDHGTGVVIGETTEIGNNVKIYQGVTLGALFVEKRLSETKRHPTIQNDVIIYAGSTILGGKTIVGHHSVIGGNVWLTESVVPYSLVYSKFQTIVQDKRDFVSPLNFSI